MASMWRKAMLYLGLGPDDEYEDDGAYDERYAAPPPQQAREQAPPAARPAPAPRSRPGRPSPLAAPQAAPEPDSGTVRTLPPPQPSRQAPPAPAPTASPRPAVRPVPASASARPHVVAPTSFNQAQDVADRYKVSQPVLLNLQGVERDLARRLIDFSSGLCYGLGGHMEKVAHQVYLLTPAGVEVSADDRRRLQDRGLLDG
jgi:cell division inhibitor SepF